MSFDNLTVLAWAAAGVLPALWWSIANVRRASRRRERQFVRRSSLLVWSLVVVYVALLQAAAREYAAFLFLAYAAAFLFVAGLLGWRRASLRGYDDVRGSYLFTRRAPFGR